MSERAPGSFTAATRQHAPQGDSPTAPLHDRPSELTTRLTQGSHAVAENATSPSIANDIAVTTTDPGDNLEILHSPNKSASAQLGLHQRRQSRKEAFGNLQVQTDLPATNRQAFGLSHIAKALPSADTISTTAAAHHLSPNHQQLQQPAGLSPMSSYFSNYNPQLHGSHSFDYGSSLSPASALPSPALSAMIDLTPLPSPIYPGDGTPKRSLSKTSRKSSLGARPISFGEGGVSRSNSLNSHNTSPRKKKNYGLLSAAVEASAASSSSGDGKAKGHGRNRSISDFVPEALYNVRPRVATLGSSSLKPEEARAIGARNEGMHREEYLANRRGHVKPSSSLDPAKTLPSPPPSNKSVTESEISDEEQEQEGVEYFKATSISTNPSTPRKKRKWRSLKLIGKGTFSKVFLATSQPLPPNSPTNSIDESKLDPAKLVAVKICEHGPAGGADEQRIKHSLDREIAILKEVSHPSVVRLKALEEEPGRTLLVLTYCTGGDLFVLASERRDLLREPLVQRMFSELVGAVRYLHKNWIVHRDIKLENVLVNCPFPQLAPTTLSNPQTHPFPLITLTDLGLSRQIPPPPASPLLTTRCGSEDYAAPELLLGQPYDGRSTDAWALGVLLYALMEGRLPFDSPPGRPDRSKNTHRIARCDWIWCRFGDEEGEWDEVRGKGWEGARGVVEGLLRKVRMGRWEMERVEGAEWVKQGVQVEGGVRRREDDGGWVLSPGS
ncbi:protein kinase domain-containing protein 48 [Elsinoe australis]|uniref:Protein kinase domain-containing protein 48 n=1 Tax=Elsinoe australis TaxID=40998 RepID=A0A4V6DT18_9PEZI|nr:protein kinase domain-containing protein 48 [Elsinoe australis]